MRNFIAIQFFNINGLDMLLNSNGQLKMAIPAKDMHS